MYHQFKSIGIWNYDKKQGWYPDVDKLPRSAYDKIRERDRIDDKEYLKGFLGSKISEFFGNRKSH